LDIQKEYTIYDIAKELNTSASTVSRALKNHPAISIVMREKIQQLAIDKGYQLNTFAQNLRTRKTRTIGLIVPHIESYFVASVVGGIEKVLNENNYNLIISQSFETSEKEITNSNTMFHNRVDGLLVSVTGDSTQILHLQKFLEKNIPVVLFDRASKEIDCIQIVIDNFNAAYQAVSHLIKQGCKNIVHIAGNQNSMVYYNRFKGYKQALLDNNLPFYSENVLTIGLNTYSGAKAAEEILKLGKKIDGVFAANDSSAIACMSVLKDGGIKIPQNICIVGFNNDPMTKYVEPKLTTIDYPGKTMGEMAANKLLTLLNSDKQKIQNEIVTLDFELIVRESSRRIK
jgi:LacI family transcriptional regulator